MLLYTALTRARNRLFLVEFEEDGKPRKKGEKGLADFAFRCFKHLDLIKIVDQIDEGKLEMTPQEHKTRGIAMISNVVSFAKRSSDLGEIKEKFQNATKRFLPGFGDDRDLHEQATKHMNAVILKVQLLDMIRNKFFDSAVGTYNLSFRMADILDFEALLLKFADLVAWDTFLLDECDEVIHVVEEMVCGTAFEIRIGDFLFQLKREREDWLDSIQDESTQ